MTFCYNWLGATLAGTEPGTVITGFTEESRQAAGGAAGKPLMTTGGRCTHRLALAQRRKSQKSKVNNGSGKTSRQFWPQSNREKFTLRAAGCCWHWSAAVTRLI